jgi:hypothetical protein
MARKPTIRRLTDAFPAEVRAAVIRDYAGGLRISDICRKYGVANTTVDRWIEKDKSIGLRGRDRNAIGAQELILPDHPTDADIPDIPGWLPSGSPHWRIVASWQFAGAVKVRLFFPTASGAGGVVMPTAKGAQIRNLRRGN